MEAKITAGSGMEVIMTKKSRSLLFGALFLFAILLRIYRISTVPLGMHIDEAGLGLNAWSIANFGTDRYGNFMPVCPSNFYGEQSAFYTYFCALLVKLFGLNIYTLRLPGVITGILAVLFGSLLIRERWGDKGFFAGLALLGIFPYFITNCRFALDCNAMLGSLTIALYALIRLIKKAEAAPEQKLYIRFLLVGVLFGITLYTYIIAAVVVAVFCILFALYYLFAQKGNRLLRLKQLFCLAFPLCLMAIPLILVFCVNYFDLEPIVTPLFSIPKMVTNRTEEVGFSLAGLPGKLRALRYPLTSDGKYGSSDRYWTMYPLSVPFALIGGIFCLYQSLRALKERRFTPDIPILFLILSEVIMFLLCGQYNYHINGIFTSLAYLVISGIFCIGGLLKGKTPRLAFYGVLGCAYGIFFFCFAREYYFLEPDYTFQIYNGASEAVSLLPESMKNNDIYILDEVGEFYMLSHPVPPAEFSLSCDELGYITDYRNYHFHESEEYAPDNVYVCNKDSMRHMILSDTSVTGCSYQVLETGHYYVFFPAE